MKIIDSFGLAGVTLCNNQGLPEQINYIQPIQAFSVENCGQDQISIDHKFELPDISNRDLGRILYDSAPWIISETPENYYFRMVLTDKGNQLNALGVFRKDYSHGTIYHDPIYLEKVKKFGWFSLTLFPTDQIILAPILADRDAAIIHSAGLIIGGSGFLFIGHSEAGKTTTTRLLSHSSVLNTPDQKVVTLCDDRNIVRRYTHGWKLYGTWSHGEIEDVSASEAELRGMFFIQQDVRNVIIPMDRKEAYQRLLATIITSYNSSEWWEKELKLIEKLVNEIPAYLMKFDKSGDIDREIYNLHPY